MESNPNRVEAERLLGISEKLLHARDLSGSRDFAVLAQEAEPLLDGSDQIIAVVDVLLAAEKPVNNHPDWYSILQIDRRSDDPDLIKKQYRKFALLLHPDKNKFPFADHAFKLVADAWSVLSNASKKPLYDSELSLFSKVDLGGPKLPVRRRQQPREAVKKPGPGFRSNNNNINLDDSRLSSFWTACPYCYNLFEYPRVYEDCCLKCQNCKRAFHAAIVPSLPPLVPGQEAYYCCWGTFPIGYVMGDSDGKATVPGGGFLNWMPPMFPNGPQAGLTPAPTPTPSNAAPQAGLTPAPTPTPSNAAPAKPVEVVEIPNGSTKASQSQSQTHSGKKKRGRPRKYPLNA